MSFPTILFLSLLTLSARVIGAEFGRKYLFPATEVVVYKGVKVGRMVGMHGVAQFVNTHIINEFIG